ncbi:MAG: DUF3999 domain-containing protein [Burkholderiales bacterium]|nr:DUF3999 domain-containing protein [Burkholderiales bacterium]
MALAITAAHAQSPSDFRSQAPVTPAAGDPLQRLTLPFEVYRDAKPDLADIRLFNAKGEALPIAFAGTPEPSRETPPATPLAMFALYSRPPGREDTGRLDIRVRSGRDGTIVSVQDSGRRETGQRPIAWLLDATQLKPPLRHVVVDWNSGPGLEVARITVEASDDLKSWRTVASRAPVLRVEQGGREVVQRKVDVVAVQAKYLRLTAEPGEFVLRSAEAEPASSARPATRVTTTVAGKPGAKPGEYVYDLGARLPIETVRLKLGEANSVAPFTLLARDNESAEGRRVASATFYRLVRQGVELESPRVEIGRQSARYWIARLDPSSPPPGGGPPTLEAEWRPAQLVYVARGDAPFTLAFGNPEAKRAMLEPSQLIPGYERLEELKLPLAQVGAIQSTGRDEWWRRVLGDTSPRKVTLWVVLLVAVAALAWMAWRLSRQVASDAPP